MAPCVHAANAATGRRSHPAPRWARSDANGPRPETLRRWWNAVGATRRGWKASTWVKPRSPVRRTRWRSSREYARQVAVGLVGLVNILDPEMVVISGGLIDLDDVLLTPLRAAFAVRIEGAAHRPEVPIVPAELGGHAGVIGAAVLARDLV